MKKVAISVIALILVFVIYYITFGSKQITKEVKKEVNKELVQLKQHGFEIKEQNVSTNKQHIVLTLDDINKISSYLKEQGQQNISSSDIEILKGMQIGMDIEYEPSAKYALAMDIYPLKLPTIFYQDIGKEDKPYLEELNKILKDKVFLVHINFDKMLSGFDGYVKDIDRKFKGEDGVVYLVSKNFKFDGDLDDGKIENITETIDRISMGELNQLDFNLSNLKFDIQKSKEKDGLSYNIKSFKFSKSDESPISLTINGMQGASEDIRKNGFLNSNGNLKILSTDIYDKGNKTKLENISVSTSIKNIDEKALKKLEKLSSSQDENESFDELIPILKELAKGGISVDIPNVSIEKIIANGKAVDGFTIKASINTDNNFTWKALDNDPSQLINIINAKVNIEISDELANMMLSANPQIMLMMMVVQPIEKNQKKYYDIEFNQGSLKINGKPFL